MQCKALFEKKVAADIRMIFNAPNREQAEAYLVEIVKKYEKIAPKLADWMEVNLPQGFSFFEFPQEHWRRIRTSNCLERVSEEINRRTRVVRVFPNEASCLRLVSAILMEIGEDWEFGRVYLQLEPD
jgi:transposase-like protein